MKRIKKLFVILFIIILLSSPIISCKNNQSGITYIGYGGQETVSGSMHCLEVNKKLYMVDAGIFYEDEANNYALPDEIDIKNIKAVFITHAHADHIGRIPLLLENGYSGPFYMTGITYDLTKIMLLSSLKYTDFNITKEELENRLKKQTIIVEYNKSFYVDSKISGFFNKLNISDKYYEKFIWDGVKAEFFYTSHIPGSAMILLNICGKDILFSGDIGSDNNPFLAKNSQFEGNIDYLFVEGTYGVDGNNDNNEEQRKQFQQLIGKKLSEGFRIIIPAFVLDRTQQVLYEIKQGMDKKFIPENTTVKVYSPTSFEITDKYMHYSMYEKDYCAFFSEKMFENLFDIQNLSYNPKNNNGSYDTSAEYGEIAVMSSGMVSHVFSKEAILKYVEDPKTFILLVGYQAEGTEGRALIEASKDEMEYIIIDGEKKKINPDNIFRTYAFNSHADLEQIFDIFKLTTPGNIFLVHMDKSNTDILMNAYKKQFSKSEIIIPEFGKRYALE